MTDALIPQDLYGAFDYLRGVPGDEDEAIGRSHHTMGQWIRNNWGLWKKEGPLYEILSEKGLWHADDMSSVVLRSFHRYLNSRSLDVDKQIQHFHDFWSEQGLDPKTGKKI